MNHAQPEVAIRFEECMGEVGRQSVEKPAIRARELVKMGRFQAALRQYREALAGQPLNWSLMIEVAHLLTFALGHPKAGLEMAQEALRFNPACSAELWNMLGDCLFYLKRLREARLAFERALAISSDDVRARYNLAFVHVEAKEYREALARLAEGLALDRPGGFREGLLRKQTEVLALISQQNQRRYLGLANRVTSTGPGPSTNADPAVATRQNSSGVPARGPEQW
jgi:tetratricopeptide (TPR) repeat protein